MRQKKFYLFAIVLFISFFMDSAVNIYISYIKLPALDFVMEWFSHEITVFAVLVIISALFLYEERKSKYIPVLFTSFFIALFASFLLKMFIMRPRPFGMEYIEIELLGFLIKLPDYAFPSAHSAMAFSVIPVLDKEFRKLKPFWLFFSGMIALSRIYLHQHFMSDVIAGIILGYVIGHYAIKISEKHGISNIISHIRN